MLASAALSVGDPRSPSAIHINNALERSAEEIDIHLGKRLRTRRRLLWMTQSEVASAVGVGFRQIHKYECGVSTISAARLWLLAEALGVTVEYFFSGLGA